MFEVIGWVSVTTNTELNGQKAVFLHVAFPFLRTFNNPYSKIQRVKTFFDQKCFKNMLLVKIVLFEVGFFLMSYMYYTISCAEILFCRV